MYERKVRSYIILNVFILVTVHGTLKLENSNWKVGLHTFVLLMYSFNFGPGFYHLVPRLCLGTLYIEALPHKQEATSCNKSKVGVRAFKS